MQWMIRSRAMTTPGSMAAGTEHLVARRTLEGRCAQHTPMAISILALAFFGCAGQSPSNAHEARHVASEGLAERARTLLAESLRAHGVIDGRGPISIRCEGNHQELGHLARPRELSESRVTRSATVDLARREARGVWSLAHDDGVSTGKIAVEQNSVYWSNPDESEARRDTSEAQTRARFGLAELVPSALLALALENPSALHLDDAQTVSFVDPSGMRRWIHVDAKTRLVTRVERLESDSVLGDDRQSTDYLAWAAIDGLVVPTRMRHRRLWYVEEEVTCAKTASAVVIGERLPAAPGKEPPHVTVARVGEGLYTARLDHLNNRTMFLERADDVIAFEAPLDSATGELVIAAIDRTTGGKPIRWLVLSHHHPDYVGGLRPFVARGTHIVTTPGNVDYIRQIAEAPHTVEPDQLARAPKPVVVEAVHAKRVLGEGATAVTLYDIGVFSSHTDEYLIYHFMRERILFVGDMVSLRPGPITAARPRAVGLLNALESLHLDVERIYQSWPVRDRVDVLTIATLRRMVELCREQTPPPMTPQTR